ncbi:MAG: HPr(Ser) kinase/phosphatase [Calditrichaeota bacterium]|nr:MAG: HPr(Ser) kinase/phosphatase [Calditrichota bacterium]
MTQQLLYVRDLFKANKERLKLEILCSENGLNRKITTNELHRPGLALSGYVDLFTWDRLQILGNTEISYLSKLSPDELKQSINRFIEFEVPAIIITNGNAAPDYLLKTAARRNISVFKTTLNTTRFVHLLGDFLSNVFAPRQSVHGTLVDVYGVGILFTGRSGIGKSEIALDLIERGHRLVADDLVILKKKAEDVLIGYGAEQSEHMMEIRGIGLVDVKAVFGVRGIRMQKRVEVEVLLEDWDETKSYERVGLHDNFTKRLDVEIPQILLPINPGKNITVISETIALNHLSKLYGAHPARDFNARSKQRMLARNASPLAEDRSYLEKDTE